MFSHQNGFTLERFQQLQHDAFSAAAAADLRLFRDWSSTDLWVERARLVLADWDATYRRESSAAALYSYVRELIPDSARRAETPVADRRALLERVLAQALDSLRAHQGNDPSQWRWGRIHRSEMPHALVRAYDIPAIERSGGAGTIAATGATFRQIIDFNDLDGSLATNLPGQSAQPGSPFYANLSEPFARGEYFPLLFTRAAVESRAAHRLTLIPVSIDRP